MPSQAIARVEWLHIEGDRLINESGEAIVLRGVNIENREWIWDYTHSIDFERRAIPVVTEEWGANLIVLAVASGPVNRSEEDYLVALDAIVALAKKNGAYTLLIYRYGEPNQEQPRMPDDSAKDAMAVLAQRYKNEPAVLYGLQVEPHRVSWSELKSVFVGMIDAMRSVNPRALIAVPGTQWSRYISFALTDPIPRENLIYKTHAYDSFATIASEYRLEEMAARYPILIGEFGVGSQMSSKDVQELLGFVESEQIHWAAWVFHEKGCPCLLQDAGTFVPTAYGQMVKSALGAAMVMPLPRQETGSAQSPEAAQETQDVQEESAPEEKQTRVFAAASPAVTQTVPGLWLDATVLLAALLGIAIAVRAFLRT